MANPEDDDAPLSGRAGRLLRDDRSTCRKTQPQNAAAKRSRKTQPQNAAAKRSRKTQPQKKKGVARETRNAFDFGSPTWARTRDLRINSPALYRLSYRGTALQLNFLRSALHKKARYG
jgi:hypothetical protein